MQKKQEERSVLQDQPLFSKAGFQVFAKVDPIR
jgi:hypothetical protein